MKAIPTELPEVLILEPTVLSDERGFFLESYNRALLNSFVGSDVTFVQDNHSHSSRGVLRGMHYQLPPHSQGKLVRVIIGRVFDVAVDMRPGSPNFGKWVGIELSAENRRQVWIPPGFAHGFLALSETADFLYKTTDYYSPGYEASVRWNDPDLNITWPALDAKICMSKKDLAAPSFRDAIPFATSKQLGSRQI